MRVQLASVTLDMCENEISTLGQSGRPHTVDPHYLLHLSSLALLQLTPLQLHWFLLLCEPESVILLGTVHDFHLRVKAQVLPAAHVALPALPYPCLPSPPPAVPLSPSCNHMGFLAAPQTCQAHPHLRAFALAVSSAQNSLISHPHIATSPCYLGVRFSFTHSEGPSLTLTIEFILLYCLHSTARNSS